MLFLVLEMCNIFIQLRVFLKANHLINQNIKYYDKLIQIKHCKRHHHNYKP